MAQIVPISSMVRKDLSQLMHNKSFIISAFFIILFNLILPNISTFQVRNVSIAMVSHDHSELAQNIMQDILHTSDFTYQGQCSTYDEALSLVQDGKVDCIIEIPENFERDFIHKSLGMKGAEPKIQISANAINTTKVMAASQSIVGSIATSFRNYARDRGVAVSGNSFVTTQNLYNPASDYKQLMLPVLFLMITFVFGTATRLITNELQYGTIDQIYVSPMSRLSFMSSKLCSCFIANMVVMLLSLLSLWVCYDFVPKGNFLLMLLAMSFYVLSCSSLALVLCNISSDTSQMVLYSSVVSLVAMMTSGFVTPLECMAEWIDPISYCMPTRYLVIILRNVSLKASSFTDLYLNFLPLAAITIIYFILAVLTCKKSRD